MREHTFVAVLQAWSQRLQRERRRGRRYQPSFRRRQIAITSLGNGLGALVGLLLLALGLQGPFALALAVALTIVLGQQLRCLHPPAGGMAFLVVYLGAGWGFLLFPVLSGSLALVLLAWAFSRWVPGAMVYPQHWL